MFIACIVHVPLRGSGLFRPQLLPVAIVPVALFIFAPVVSHIPRSAAIRCVTRGKSNPKTAEDASGRACMTAK